MYADNNKSNATTAVAAKWTRTEDSGQHLVLFGRGRACRVGLTSSVGQKARGLRIEAWAYMYKILNDIQWRVAVSILFEVEIDADLGIIWALFPHGPARTRLVA